MSIRHLACLFSSLVLAGCGAGSSQGGPVASPAAVAIGGTVTGVPAGDTLILTNGNLETLAIRSSGNFVFTKKVAAGADYSVSIFGQSSGLNCTLANASGNANASSGDVANITVACTPGVTAMIRFFVGVTVSGLAPGASVTFTNNGSDALTATDNGFYIFRNDYFKEGVYSGKTGGYTVAVQSNPTGQTCSVTGGSGAFGLGPDQTGDFVNVAVVCK